MKGQLFLLALTSQAVAFDFNSVFNAMLNGFAAVRDKIENAHWSSKKSGKSDHDLKVNVAVKNHNQLDSKPVEYPAAPSDNVFSITCPPGWVVAKYPISPPKLLMSKKHIMNRIHHNHVVVRTRCVPSQLKYGNQVTIGAEYTSSSYPSTTIVAQPITMTMQPTTTSTVAVRPTSSVASTSPAVTATAQSITTNSTPPASIIASQTAPAIASSSTAVAVTTEASTTTAISSEQTSYPIETSQWPSLIPDVPVILTISLILA